MIEDNAHVSSQANAPGVGNPLPIKDQEIRPDRQLLKRPQNSWAFPECEQAGDIRVGNRRLGCRAIYRGQICEPEHDHSRTRQTFTDADIHACHCAHTGRIECSLCDDALCQLGLEGNGLGG